MAITIEQAIPQLLDIVKQLQTSYSKRKFTLDGRLVGDMGEVLVESSYDIELYEINRELHDGKTSDGREVQIKATMKNALSFPVEGVPAYYLGIKIHDDGKIEEIYNGPGSIIARYVENRERTKNGLHMISVSALKQLDKKVETRDRVKKRANPG